MTSVLHPLDALGSPVRREILRRLSSGPLAVHELASRFSVSRPAISRHLRVLQDAGLVEVRSAGTRSLYSVRLKGFESARAYLDDFWGIALRRLEERSRR
ncbi:MAG: winged helix-turn-helix transcriptional regulator [Candidatus Eisenbacteria bacterium]|uniref:Winged helix-turn-helix transcriptional regulator n=1 Tax=Eiseniibacteriota bacterium TaxID=2212470 RepID=A0A849SZW9_UNCEI|nr:winged helix-turn-helix transcriptional regulator [Candidatus Eisenbacteria bacterium]